MHENHFILLRFAVSLLDVISTLAFCTFVFRKRVIFAYKTRAKLHSISRTPNRIEFAEPKIASGITHTMDGFVFC